MSMSQGDAVNLNTLLLWLLDQPGSNGEPITDTQLRRTAMALAGRVRDRLAAGVRPDEVVERWSHGAPAPAVASATRAALTDPGRPTR